MVDHLVKNFCFPIRNKIYYPKIQQQQQQQHGVEKDENDSTENIDQYVGDLNRNISGWRSRNKVKTR